jgi:large subunit ribosomal protein L24
MARKLKKLPKVKIPTTTVFKKGDRLQLLTGKNTKAVGALKQIKLDKHMVIIEGLNMCVRHKKANAQTNEPGGRINMEAPIHISNVALVCPKCMKPTRVGLRILPPLEEGGKKRKIRVCKRCQAHIDD